MPSPADRQVQAQRQVTTIARALREAFHRHGEWLSLADCERVIGDLLRAGRIRAPRLEPVEEPMVGQTTIEEQLDD